MLFVFPPSLQLFLAEIRGRDVKREKINRARISLFFIGAKLGEAALKCSFGLLQHELYLKKCSLA